ncbi:hypothetical protein ACSU1N_02725 [Thermogladius sp. 4427co]|uniref:hypothetical protein n=1 Tax=Thermogladius sp. 4427co TaxID=3450718 RepID=UPI003F790FA7
MVSIVIDFAGSAHLILNKEEAINLLKKIREYVGESNNLAESIRMIENFDEFYRLSRKRFEEYLFPPKDPSESLKGKVVIQKLRFIKDNGDFVEIVFDRRIKIELIKDALSKIGYSEVTIEKQEL